MLDACGYGGTGMQESAVAVDELTAQIAVQDKLLQVLSTREANIADKITDTERKLTVQGPFHCADVRGTVH